MDERDNELSGRDRALLRAVAAGRCQIGGGCEPVLLVDGLACADCTAAHRLIGANLVVPPDPTPVLAAARLTAAGRAVLDLARAA